MKNKIWKKNERGMTMTLMIMAFVGLMMKIMHPSGVCIYHNVIVVSYWYYYRTVLVYTSGTNRSSILDSYQYGFVPVPVR